MRNIKTVKLRSFAIPNLPRTGLFRTPLLVQD
jgi:hypothetical protein